MILHGLRHVGTHAFPSAEISIDFEKLPALIGVCGPNGSGKTTCFDLIVSALYLTMPFRPGALYHNFLADGFTHLAWELDEQIYVSDVRVSLDPEKVEALLSVIQEDGTSEIIAGPLSRDYRRAIEAILGPLDVFMATAYAAQNNAGSFLKAARADRKAVLSEMLGLQRYPRLLEATKAKAAMLETRLTTLRTQLAGYEAKAAERPTLEARRATLEAQRAALDARREHIQVELVAAREQATQAREEKAALDPLGPELQRLEREIADITQRIAGHDQRLTNNRALLARGDEILAAVTRDAELRTTKTRLEALRPERGQLGAQLDELGRRIARIQGDVVANRVLLTRAEEIRTACKRDGEIAGQILVLDADIEQARAAHQEMTAERSRLLLRRQETVGRVITLTADVERYTRQESLRSSVPCEGAGIYAACQFLADASQAVRELPQAQEALQLAQADLDRLIVPDAPTDGSLALQARKTALQRERSALANVVALQASLDASEARLETYATQLAEAEGDRTAKVTRRDALDTELATLPALEAELVTLTTLVGEKPVLDAATSRIEELTAATISMQADLRAKTDRRTDVAATLASLPALEEQAQATQRAVNEAEQHRHQAQQDIAALERDLGSVETQLAAAMEAEHGAERVRGELGPVGEDSGDWHLLSRAFGASGIPQLLIDAALPELGALATDLLRDCLGEGLFTIELTTQRESADGERKLETLDVIVSRGGKPLDALLLSGGESVLVSEALSLALALYNATRSGRSIRTLLRDEVGAALDIERAPAYAAMLRRAAKLGQFRHVLYVSHNERALALADAQLEVGGGMVRVG